MSWKISKVIFAVALLCTLAANKISAQQVVNDPTANATLISLHGEQVKNVALIGTVVEKLRQAQEMAKKINDANVIQSMQSLQQINTLLEAIVCQHADFMMYVDLVGESCIMDVRYQSVLTDMQFNSDMIKYGLLSMNLLTMGSSERIGMMNKVIERLQKTIDTMNKINNGIRLQLNTALLNKYLARQNKEAGITFTGRRGRTIK